MTLHPAYEVLRQHGIRFVTNSPDGTFTSNCKACGKNNNFVQYDDDHVSWHCHDCGDSKIVPLRRAKPDGAQTGGNGASVPFMLTAAHKVELRALGYSDEQIHHLTPQEGQDIIAHKRNPPVADDDAGRKFAEALRELHSGDQGAEGKPPPATPSSAPPAGEAAKTQENGDGRLHIVEHVPEPPPPARKKGYDAADAIRDPSLRIVPMPERPLDQSVEQMLKDNPHGPVSDKQLEQFERLAREQVEDFARLARSYPALAAAIRLDAAAVRAALENADKDKVVKLFRDLAVVADLDPVEIDTLRRLTAEKAGVGLQPLKDLLKQAQAKQALVERAAAKAQRLAARTDPRPIIDVPAYDAPWLPIADTVNAVLGASTASAPPERDIDGVATRGRKLAVPKMHAFANPEANPETEDER